MDYERFYQSVVLAYINHDGDPIRFFDDVVAALNQFREEKQSAQQPLAVDGATVAGFCECGTSIEHHTGMGCLYRPATKA